MKYKTDAYRADEARAIAAARIVVATNGWDLRSGPTLISIRDAPWFYEARAHLLVLAGVDGWPYGIAAVQRDLRCSALLISAGRTPHGGATGTPSIAVALAARSTTIAACASGCIPRKGSGC